ncbi:bacterial Ig-like domain-containing protein, partial [Vagococcus fessus]|uniref:bacterial Ig-like domain-containing protein n=1 Tax=Vagococcus fessus TaxID=120370 RepID=UPI0039ED73AB
MVEGSEWHSEDNFIKATDKLGKTISFDQVKVTGSVDTSKLGEYQVSYTYKGMTVTATISVVAKPERPEVWPGEEINLTSIEAKPSTITVGSTWKAEDNFIKLTDKLGKEVAFSEVKVIGTVDTSKIGEYDVTYEYEGVSTVITVTVVEEPERPEVWPGEE